MKILEAQSALLSNYEVYAHINEQKARYIKDGKSRRGPPNLQMVVRELRTHLETAPNPLSQKPLTYAPESIGQLLQRLRPFDLSKGEVLMILNLRPNTVAALNTVVEDMPERLTEQQQEALVEIISDVLGQFPARAATQNGEGAGTQMDTSG